MNSTTFIPYQKLKLINMSTERIINIIRMLATSLQTLQ